MVFNLATRGMGVGDCNPARNGERAILSRWLPTRGSAPVVWDVGANEGDYTAVVRSVCPAARIFAFEPNPPTYSRLAARWTNSGVRCFQNALGRAEGALELWDYEGAPTGSSHATFHPVVVARVSGERLQPRVVPVQTIDGIAAREQVSRIDLLKMDVEGHELACLEGAARMITEGRVAAVQFEFNSMHLEARANIYDFAECLPGFVLYRILPHGLLQIDLKNPTTSNLYGMQNIFAIAAREPRG
jgi:FkbM family methyltransferase